MQRPLPDNTQHSQQTDIHTHGGIRTRNSGKRAAAVARLCPRGHWDRHVVTVLCYVQNILIYDEKISLQRREREQNGQQQQQQLYRNSTNVSLFLRPYVPLPFPLCLSFIAFILLLSLSFYTFFLFFVSCSFFLFLFLISYVLPLIILLLF
jgi:hypothetical protein